MWHEKWSRFLRRTYGVQELRVGYLDEIFSVKWNKGWCLFAKFEEPGSPPLFCTWISLFFAHVPLFTKYILHFKQILFPIFFIFYFVQKHFLPLPSTAPGYLCFCAVSDSHQNRRLQNILVFANFLSQNVKFFIQILPISCMIFICIIFQWLELKSIYDSFFLFSQSCHRVFVQGCYSRKLKLFGETISLPKPLSNLAKRPCQHII